MQSGCIRGKASFPADCHTHCHWQHVWVHPAWAWFTVFIGLNLIQSAYTGLCPAAWAFRKLGFKPGEAF